MHLAFLLLIILFVIFFVPLLALVQMVVRFISRLFFGRSEGTAGNPFGRQSQNISRLFFGRSEGTAGNPFGRQSQNRAQSGRTTWYTSSKKSKKKIDSSEGEYIDFEDIKE